MSLERIPELEISACTFIDSFFELIERDKYDLFVLDLMMESQFHAIRHQQPGPSEQNPEGLTGIVVAKKIREIEMYKDVPIIFFSMAHIDPTFGFDRQNTRYVNKISDSPNKLLKTIKELLHIE